MKEIDAEQTLAKSPEQPACVKCGFQDFELGEIRASGGFFSTLFDFSTKRFTYSTCLRCSYTEFYKRKLKKYQMIFDFISD